MSRLGGKIAVCLVAAILCAQLVTASGLASFCIKATCCCEKSAPLIDTLNNPLYDPHYDRIYDRMHDGVITSDRGARPCRCVSAKMPCG